MSRSNESSESIPLLRVRVGPWATEALQRSADLGFLGGMPLADQVDHALGFVSVVESALGRAPHTVLDLGSGGGLPGLVLVSCWPSARMVLLDSNDRRVDFLTTEVAGQTVAGEVEVVRGRAEDLARTKRFREKFDLVTSRSFGSPGVTAECGAPFLEIGGLMVISEPPDDAEHPLDSRWPSEGLKLLGLQPSTRHRVDARFGYQVLAKSDVTPNRYPRRVGIPSKRPLF
jgi:16S rRNA (guanine527-N7)-methyltransferase